MTVASYTHRENPSVFEYGAGASTLWHLKNLLPIRGTYTAVEHQLDWYGRVLEAILKWGIDQGAKVDCTAVPSETGYDTQVSIASNAGACDITLMHRPPLDWHGGDGTGEEFAAYVTALDRPHDVVIIDGRARVACVEHVMHDELVLKGGTLALFDAGRGEPGWLGSRHQTGTSDYRSAVRAMLKLGGRIIDGNGIDSWPELRGRRAGVNAHWYPVEACFLRVM